MRLPLLATMLTAILLGCPPPRVQSPNPMPVPDTELCGAMCGHLAQLGCEEGNAVYDSDLPGPRRIPNLSCTDFCAKQQGNGIFVNPRCVLKAPTCGTIENWRAMRSCP